MLKIVTETTLSYGPFSAQLSALAFKGTFSPSVLTVVSDRPTGTKQEADDGLRIRTDSDPGRDSAQGRGRRDGGSGGWWQGHRAWGGGGRRDLGIWKRRKTRSGSAKEIWGPGLPLSQLKPAAGILSTLLSLREPLPPSNHPLPIDLVSILMSRSLHPLL